MYMQNQFYVEKDTDIIVSVYEGTQTEQSINEIAQAVVPTIKELRAAGRPVRLLIDSSRVTKQDSGARRAALQGINTLDYDKMAIFGAPLLIKHVVQFLLKVSNRIDQVQYFDTEEQARRWILES